jgi:hypothetical protein
MSTICNACQKTRQMPLGGYLMRTCGSDCCHYSVNAIAARQKQRQTRFLAELEDNSRKLESFRLSLGA